MKLVCFEKIACLQFTAGYPNELPTIVVADKLSNLGLEEHLQQVLRAYQGSPLLLQLLDAVKNWVEAHPLAFTQPTAAAEDKLAQRESATRKTGKNRHEERSPRKKQTDSYYDPLNDSTTPDKLSNLGLEEHLQQVLRAYQGSPLLLQLLDAVKNWVEAHPLAFTQPTAAAEDKLAQRESATRKTGKNRHEERSPRKKQTDSYYDPLNDSSS